MLRNLLLDLDGVIFNFKKAESVSLQNAFEFYHIAYDKDTIDLYHTINDRLWADFEKGLVTKEEVTNGRFVKLFETLNVDVDAKMFAKFYQDGLASSYFLYGDVLPFLEEMSSKLRIYAITNGVSKTAFQRLEGTDTRKYFLDVFVSEDLNAQKPSLDYFNQVMDRIKGFNKEESIIVGDSLSSDIQGALNIQVQSIYLNRYHKENISNIKPDYEVSSLEEVRDIICDLMKSK